MPAASSASRSARQTEGEPRELLLGPEEDEPTDPLGVFPPAEGRLCDLDTLLEGALLTHEVTAEDRAAQTFQVDCLGY